MASSNRRNNRSNFDKVDFDKTMGQFIDVGRQFVDGVSGARPGSRRPTNLREFSTRNAKNVRKWVNDRVDSFFDEEYDDDWEYENDNNQTYNSYNEEKNYSKNSKYYIKRPLQAISLRQSKESIAAEPKQLPYSENFIDQDWPEDSDFQVNRWKRSERKKDTIIIDDPDQALNPKIRNLPKSRRRRI